MLLLLARQQQQQPQLSLQQEHLSQQQRQQQRQHLSLQQQRGVPGPLLRLRGGPSSGPRRRLSSPLPRLEGLGAPASQPAPQDAGQIWICVRDVSGAGKWFTMRRDACLDTLADAHCAKRGLRRCDMRYIYDCDRVDGRGLTLASLGIEDGDTVDAILALTGD